MLRAGYNRQNTSGLNMGVFIGDVGMDWHSCDNVWFHWVSYNPEEAMKTYQGMHNTVTCSRISYLLDLRGPMVTHDTACSASLVAMDSAVTHMHKRWTQCIDLRVDESPECLVMGNNCLVGPGSFIGNCAANMLSHIGRCFTFDRTADGYQRGEGCAGTCIKLTDNEKDIFNRLAVITGTMMNHDGRSASLTAPNGPSQQP